MFGKIICLLGFIMFGVGFVMGMSQCPKDNTVGVLLLACVLVMAGALMWPETSTMPNARPREKKKCGLT